jgi:hypothetical protein
LEGKITIVMGSQLPRKNRRGRRIAVFSALESPLASASLLVSLPVPARASRELFLQDRSTRV